MLTSYIKTAMHRATYEILSDDGTFYAEISGFQGVYANAPSLEACRDELEEVLEEWILFRVSKQLPLPTIKEPLRSSKGILKDLNVNLTEEDIAEARREMWGNFPRDIEL